MPTSETKWPRKETCDWKNIYFSGFTFRLTSAGRFKTSSQFLKCILNVWPKTMISSSYIKRETNVMSETTLSMTRSEHTGLVILPNRTTLNCHNPLFRYAESSQRTALWAGCGIWLYQFLIIAYLFTFLCQDQPGKIQNGGPGLKTTWIRPKHLNNHRILVKACCQE